MDDLIDDLIETVIDDALSVADFIVEALAELEVCIGGVNRLGGVNRRCEQTQRYA